MDSRPGRAHRQELRARALAAVDSGVPVYQVAPLVGVSVSFVYKALKERRVQRSLVAETAVPPATPRRGRPQRVAGNPPDGPVMEDKLDPAKTMA
jgi:transposase